MSNPNDWGDRLHALAEALAEQAATLSDKEVADDAAADGTDVKKEAMVVRGVLLAGLQRAKKDRLNRALAQRERVLASLKSSAATLPPDAASRRTLLADVIQRKPQVRDAVMTLQHRDFDSMSDDDVDSILIQAHLLGLLDNGDSKK